MLMHAVCERFFSKYKCWMFRGKNAQTYIIMEGLRLTAVVTGLSSLRRGTVQVPKHTETHSV